MGEDENSNEKSIFVISFLALIFTLPNYKDYLETIKISFFSFSLSLYILFLLMGLVLFFSVYFLAIDNLNYCSLNFRKMNRFFHTSLIADLLYTTAILVFPAIVFLLYISSSIIAYVKSNFHHEAIPLIQLISIMLSILVILRGYKLASDINSEMSEANIEKASDSESNSLLKATKAYENGLYDYMFLELSNAIEKSLYAKLARNNLIGNSKHASLFQLMNFAEKEKLLNEEQKTLIKQVGLLRNQIAHGRYEEKINKDDAELLLNGIKKLTFDLSNID